MAEATVENTPSIVLRMTVDEAAELSTALGHVYGMTSNVENQLYTAVYNEVGNNNPYETFKDDDGDYAVRRIAD